MVGIRKSLFALSILVALPSPAAAADLCTSLNSIIASSRESPPFASVRRALGHGEAIVPGFGAAQCQLAPATGIDCFQSSTGVSHFDDWPDVGACLGVEPEVAPRVTRPRRPRDWSRTYVASGLRFEYGVECIGCAGLASSHFTVSFDGRARSDR